MYRPFHRPYPLGMVIRNTQTCVHRMLAPSHGPLGVALLALGDFDSWAPEFGFMNPVASLDTPLLHADTYLVLQRLGVLDGENGQLLRSRGSRRRLKLTTRLRPLRHSLGEHRHKFL